MRQEKGDPLEMESQAVVRYWTLVLGTKFGFPWKNSKCYLSLRHLSSSRRRISEMKVAAMSDYILKNQLSFPSL